MSPNSNARSTAVDAAARRAAQRLRRAGSVTVVGHINPDGDALGSVLALTEGLRTIGVPAVATWGARHEGQEPAPLSDALAAVLPTDGLVAAGMITEPPEVLVSCDTAAASRLGTLSHLAAQATDVVVIDHHAVGEPFGDIRVVDEHASCTGVLVLEVLRHLDVPLTPPLANAIYLALLTDTGRFGFSSTGPADHRVAAGLLEAGADHAAVGEAVYASASRGYLTLVSRVTRRATVTDTMVSSYVTLDDLAQTRTSSDEPDGLIDLLRRVGDIDVTCFLRETQPLVWRSSLRSRGGTDVAQIARAMGGGGHRRAAGFTGRGTASEVVAAVRSLLPEEQLEVAG